MKFKNNHISILNKESLFFILLALYYILNLLTSPLASGMSGVLQAEHNNVNQIISGLIIVYMVIYILTSSLIYNNICKCIILFISYTLIRETFCFIDDPEFAKSNLNALFPVIYWTIGIPFSFKCLEKINHKQLIKLLQMVIVVYLFFVGFRTVTQKAILAENDIIAGINVGGSVYMIVPLVLLAFKGKTKVFFFLACAFLCILSAKRQAVLGMAIVALFTFKDIYKSYFNNNRTIGIILVVLFLVAGRNVVVKSFDDLYIRQENFIENESSIDSGRFELREASLKGFRNADLFSKIFGGGAGTAAEYIEQELGFYRAPHCGFIDILGDFGVIGEVLFLYFFISVLRFILKIKSKKYKYIGLAIWSSWIFCNMISHVANLNFMFLSIGLGYIYIRYRKETLLKRKSYKNTDRQIVRSDAKHLPADDKYLVELYNNKKNIFIDNETNKY